MAVTILVVFGQLLVTSVWNAYPFALPEAMVLAFFAGYLWHRRLRQFESKTAADPIAVPAALFTLVVVASCIAQLPALQIWHDYPVPYARSFFEFLTEHYLTSLPDPRSWVDGRALLSTAALLVEGVALLVCTRRLCREQPRLAHRLTNVAKH